MSDSKKHPIYIAQIDEVDPTLPTHTRKAQEFAKMASLIPGYLGWLMVALMFLVQGSILNSMTPGTMMMKTMQWLTDSISKGARLVWYHIFFWPAKLVLSLIDA